MYVDFTNLNKASSKDSFPLPHIDQLADATAGHKLLSFMDAYSSYNQIMMHPDKGLYCYKVMPFGLKNAGATYQRLVNMMFSQHIINIVEVYVDDMLVKNVKTAGHTANLQVIFDILKQYRMELNPQKCLFCAAAGKFLDYVVSQQGIEANHDKVQAILDMESPTTKEHVQCLTGRCTYPILTN